MRRVLAALARCSSSSLVVLAACSDDATSVGDSPDSASTTPPEPSTPDAAGLVDAAVPVDAEKADRAVSADAKTRISAYDGALAKAVCAKLYGCCSDGDVERYAAQFSDAPYKVSTKLTASTCEAVLTQAFDALYLTKWGVSVSVGNITFDDARGQKCLDAVSAAACGTPLVSALYDGACFGVRGNEVFRKVARLGAACDDIGDTTFIGECDPSLGYCGEGKTCVPWKKTGEACGILIQDAGPAKRLFCAPGTNCDGQSARTPGKCSGPAQNVALGATCSSLSGPDLVCPAGAYCDVLGTGKCVAQLADGQVCTGDDECVSARPFTCSAPPTSGDGGSDAGAPRTCGSTSFCKERR
jgi:hypothetical protein